MEHEAVGEDDGPVKRAIGVAVETLIKSYHELNATSAEELRDEPTPLEFMRRVHLNRPFVVRGGAASWRAVRKWNAQYLSDAMRDSPVKVACTPFGNADSVVSLDDGSLAFVKPHEITQPFREALHLIQSQELHPQEFRTEWIRYLQTQNDNLRGEYDAIFRDVPRDIPFVRIALQQVPDAINFWLGNSRSTTALHKDNYENVYVQVLGRKRFVLLPPVEAPCVNEQRLRAATYVPDPSSQALKVKMDEREDGSQDPPTLPFATWDPEDRSTRPSPFSHLSRPITVTLEPGDMLYLPARWYHKVGQSCSDEGICVAVNYWYDMEYAGSFDVLSCFVGDVGIAVCRG